MWAEDALLCSIIRILSAFRKVLVLYALSMQFDFILYVIKAKLPAKKCLLRGF